MRTYLVTQRHNYSAISAENFAEARAKALKIFGDFDSITHLVKTRKEAPSEEMKLALFDIDRKVNN